MFERAFATLKAILIDHLKILSAFFRVFFQDYILQVSSPVYDVLGWDWEQGEQAHMDK